MSISLVAPQSYDRGVWQQLLNAITAALQAVFMKGQNVELARGEKLILRSPNGTRYYLVVDNAGALTTAAV